MPSPGVRWKVAKHPPIIALEHVRDPARCETHTYTSFSNGVGTHDWTNHLPITALAPPGIGSVVATNFGRLSSGLLLPPPILLVYWWCDHECSSLFSKFDTALRVRQPARLSPNAHWRQLRLKRHYTGGLSVPVLYDTRSYCVCRERQIEKIKRR